MLFYNNMSEIIDEYKYEEKTINLSQEITYKKYYIDYDYLGWRNKFPDNNDNVIIFNVNYEKQTLNILFTKWENKKSILEFSTSFSDFYYTCSNDTPDYLMFELVKYLILETNDYLDDLIHTEEELEKNKELIELFKFCLNNMEISEKRILFSRIKLNAKIDLK